MNYFSPLAGARPIAVTPAPALPATKANRPTTPTVCTCNIKTEEGKGVVLSLHILCLSQPTTLFKLRWFLEVVEVIFKRVGGLSLNMKVKMALSQNVFCVSARSWACSPVILGSMACGCGVIILLFIITIIYCNSKSKPLPLVLNVHRPNYMYCVHF